MRLRRSRPILAAGLLAALIGTAACTPDGQRPKTVQPSASSGPQRVTLAVYGSADVISTYTQLASTFQQSHPQITVNVRPYPSHTEAIEALHKNVGTDRAPDLFLTDETDLPWLEEQKANQPVDSLLTERNIDFGDSYERTGLEAFSSADALQCMPTEVSPLMVYYNADLVHLPQLREPGEPVASAETGWRWADFVEAARQASEGRTKGVSMEPNLTDLAPFILSGGGQLVDDETDPTTLTLADDGNRAALRQVLELVRNPDFTFTRAQLNKRDALSRFKAGQLGMMLGHRDLTPELREQEGLTFGVMPLPRIGRSATVADIRGLCLNSEPANTPAAADLLAYLVSDDASKQLAKTGSIVPANIIALHSDDFADGVADPIGAEAFGNQNRYVRDLPDVITWDTVVANVGPELTKLFFDPIIDPLEDRLTAIDERSATIFKPESASASPSASGSATTQ